MPTLIETLKNGNGSDRLAIEPVIGEFLYNEVKSKKPKTVVEVGTGNGYSSSWLARGLEENGFGKLFTFDREVRSLAWLKRFDPSPQILRVVGEFRENLDSLPPWIYFLFLDADHTINDIVGDLEACESRLVDGAMVYVHDTVYVKNMGDCLADYFNGINSERLNLCDVKASKSKWEYKDFQEGSGLGIARLIKGEKNVS